MQAFCMATACVHALNTVNHAYRFIFVRHPKCASSALLHHFTLCSERRATKSCLEPWNGNPASSVANASEAAIHAMWQDYFVFTVVRNPLARAVSAYKFVLSATVADEECADRMDWDGFCGDPLLAGELCRRKPQCCPFGPLFAWSHVIDQARCMTTLGGGLAVDYVARMEAIDEDVPQLFAEINARRPAGLPPLEVPPSIKQVLPSSTGGSGGGGSSSDGDGDVGGGAEGGGCGVGLAPQRHRAAARPGFFFAVSANFTSVVAKESAYCGLQDFYTGRHAHCLPSVRRAYGGDLRLLYPPAEAVVDGGTAAQLAAGAAGGRRRVAAAAAAGVSGGGSAADEPWRDKPG
ncbi:hypothetical protein ABPG75_004513 [Micractinium tetrahymenae]